MITSIFSIKNVFKATHKYIAKIIMVSALSLCILLVVVSALDYYFIQMQSLAELHGNEFLDTLAEIGRILTNFLVSIHLIFLIPLRACDVSHNVPKLTSASKFAMKTFWQLLLESIRAMASVILWAIAFILPGVYRSIQLYFVPFVVFFDKDYAAGEVDALKRSVEIVKGSTVFIAVIIISEAILGFGFKKVLEDYSALPAIGISIASYTFIILLSCYTYSLFFFFYSQKAASLKGDPT